LQYREFYIGLEVRFIGGREVGAGKIADFSKKLATSFLQMRDLLWRRVDCRKTATCPAPKPGVEH
jgi:hypothetical protein